MRIPTTAADRELFYQELIESCFASRTDRKALYSILKNYYLFGNGEQQNAVDYNKLFPHLDLLASFLFSGETTQFVIEVPDDVDKQDPDIERKKSKKIVPKLNRAWHNSNLDLVFNDALIWSLVFNTSFVKFVPSSHRAFSCHVIEPHAVGVLREDIQALDDQEAITFEFLMSRTELERRIAGFGEDEKKRILSAAEFTQVTSSGDTLPLPMQRLIVNATKPTIAGSVIQQQNPAQYDFNPKITEDVCIAQEVWVWDDDRQDYVCATMINSQTLLSDFPSERVFLKGEQPFVKLCPNPIYNYFWGRSEEMYLIPLQLWVNTRISEIKAVLAKIANPPKSATGIDGLTDEKMEAFGQPGSFIYGTLPVAGKAEIHNPNPPADLFREMQMIESMFSDVSGIRELMQGKGESGVRATSHADLLVRVGSSRVKKKAAVLEDAVEKCGSLILQMIRKYDDVHLKTDDGLIFIPNQLSPACTVKVDSHSSSPIFVEQQMDKAMALFETGAYDKEDLVDAIKVQNSDYIKAKIREREKREAPLAQIAEIVMTAKEAEAPGILAKLKAFFKGGKK